MARPLAYTPKVHRAIVAAVRGGNSLRDAVGFGGAAWPTFNRWMKAGRLAIESEELPEGADPLPGADPRFAPLVRDVDQAMHAANVALVESIRRAAADQPGKPKTKTRPAIPPRPGDWRAAQFLLEFREGAKERRTRVRKLKAEAVVAEKRAAGILPPEKSEITGANGGPIAVNALHGRLASLAARAAGGVDPGAARDPERG